jgi:hypothetical protein
MLGTSAMPETHGNLLIEMKTHRGKCKRGIKETYIVCAIEDNASSNGDDRERVRKALMIYDALW